jgi:hypothetical protein
MKHCGLHRENMVRVRVLQSHEDVKKERLPAGLQPKCDRFCLGMDVELFVDVLDVRTNSINADAQLVGDHLVGRDGVLLLLLSPNERASMATAAMRACTAALRPSTFSLLLYLKVSHASCF